MTIKEYRTRVAVGSDLFRAHPGVDFVRWSVEVSELFVSILFCSALCDSVSNNGVLEIYHNPSYVDKSGGGVMFCCIVSKRVSETDSSCPTV